MSVAWFMLGVLVGPAFWFLLWIAFCYVVPGGTVKATVNGKVRTWHL